MINVINTAVTFMLYLKVKKVNPKGFHHKENNFFLFRTYMR